MKKENKITAETFSIILSKIKINGNLDRGNLVLSKIIKSEDKQEILKILKEFIIENANITHLTLSDNDLNSKDLEIILPALQSSKIEYIDLSNNKLQNKGIVFFAENSKNISHLKLVNFANNEIDLTGMIVVFKIMYKFAQSIKFLWGDYNLSEKEYDFLSYVLDKGDISLLDDIKLVEEDPNLTQEF